VCVWGVRGEGGGGGVCVEGRILCVWGGGDGGVGEGVSKVWVCMLQRKREGLRMCMREGAARGQEAPCEWVVVGILNRVALCSTCYPSHHASNHVHPHTACC
jgi:hypothetical protein